MSDDLSGLVLVRSVAEVRALVRSARAEGNSMGLVPTMGALHEGHAHLIEACRRDADFVVVSIFVNPAQFGPSEDLGRYPRTLEADLRLCASAGASVVFHPEVVEMYPSGRLETFVEVPGLSDRLEGEARPGHFRGVATVVLKLLNIVGPDLAHFGEKDFQQLLVIQKLVEDLDVPVEIRGVPTVREPDGLALSSRNRYLDPAQREAATVLSRALQGGIRAVLGGERSADRVRQVLRQTVESERRAELDYAEVADAETLEPLSSLDGPRPARLLIAARVGPARLIDNAGLPFPL
jgi:pantoate--beta-alanine ligase